MIRNGFLAGCAAVVLAMTACNGDEAETGSDSDQVTTTQAEVPEITQASATMPGEVDEATISTTEPAAETTVADAVLSDLLGFIEVSARIGLAEDADVVALAVDRETLSGLPLGTIEDSPAWCSGAEELLFDETNRLALYVVRIGEPALDATIARAERFELRATDVSLGEGAVGASIELMVDGRRHEVIQGELDLGETPTGGTFRGITTDNEILEGAFLCG
jgi:hypothetical protein